MCEIASTECCGVQELAFISEDGGPESVLTTLAREHSRLNGVVMFSGVSRYRDPDAVKEEGEPAPGYARKLAAYIRTNQLGEVVGCKATLNTNSGNHIKVYLWSVDMAKLQDWWKSRNILMRNRYGL